MEKNRRPDLRRFSRSKSGRSNGIWPLLNSYCDLVCELVNDQVWSGKKVAELVYDFLCAQNLVADQVAVMELVYNHDIRGQTNTYDFVASGFAMFC